MQDESISGMAAAVLPLTGEELVPLIQSGGNVQTPASNLFQSGTWTPAYSSGYASVGYDSRLGRYVKAGTMVTAWGYINTSGASNVNSSAIIVSGLPFTASNAASVPHGGGYFTESQSWGTTLPLIQVPKNGTTIAFYKVDNSAFKGSDMGSADNICAFVVTYETV